MEDILAIIAAKVSNKTGVDELCLCIKFSFQNLELLIINLEKVENLFINNNKNVEQKFYNVK